MTGEETSDWRADLTVILRQNGDRGWSEAKAGASKTRVDQKVLSMSYHSRRMSGQAWRSEQGSRAEALQG